MSSLRSSKKRASSRPFKPPNQNYWHHNTRHSVAYRQSAIKSHFPQGRSSIPFQNTGGASFSHACYTDFKDKNFQAPPRVRYYATCSVRSSFSNASLPRTSTFWRGGSVFPWMAAASSGRSHDSIEVQESFTGWWQRLCPLFSLYWALSQGRKAPCSKTSF